MELVEGWIDPELEVPTLLYIGRRGRVTERAIGLIDYVPSLLQQIDPSYHPERTIVLWFALISTLVDCISPCRPPLDGYWADSSVMVIYMGGTGTLGPYL